MEAAPDQHKDQKEELKQGQEQAAEDRGPRGPLGVKFRKYSSIASSQSEQLMEPFIMEGWTDPKHEWVATEKSTCAFFYSCTSLFSCVAPIRHRLTN